TIDDQTGRPILHRFGLTSGLAADRGYARSRGFQKDDAETLDHLAVADGRHRMKIARRKGEHLVTVAEDTGKTHPLGQSQLLGQAHEPRSLLSVAATNV